jgi:hypothetical protein
VEAPVLDGIVASHHRRRDTLTLVERHVRGGSRLIRIATGFCNLPVHGASRPKVEGTLTRLLAGFDESAGDAILQNLLLCGFADPSAAGLSSCL